MTNSNPIRKQGSLRRSILAVFAGAVTAIVLIMAVQQASALVYPSPAGLDPDDREAMAAYTATMPAGAFLFVLASYAVGTFGGAWLAAWIARRVRLVHGMIIALLLLLASIANLLMLPGHPAWFAIANLALIPVAAWLGVKCIPSRN